MHSEPGVVNGSPSRAGAVAASLADSQSLISPPMDRHRCGPSVQIHCLAALPGPMGCRFGVQLRTRDACSRVPLAAQSRSAGLRMPRGGKRVSEGVAARRLCHPRGHHGPANLFLNDRAIEVVAPLLPTAFPNPAAWSLACRPLARCHHHGFPPLHAGPHHPVEVPGIHLSHTAHAPQPAAGSGVEPHHPQSGSARHTGSPAAAAPVSLPPYEWSCRRRWQCIREPAMTQPLHMLLQLRH